MKVWEIIRVIEDSSVKAVSHTLTEAVFQTPEGFRFEVFFDCGDPDYINWFEGPGVERIEFWGSTPAAVAHLASNLITLPHVAMRLCEAAGRAGFDFVYWE